jgi:hypothetical protein
VEYLANFGEVKQLLVTPQSDYLVALQRRNIYIIDVNVREENGDCKYHKLTHALNLYVAAIHPKEQFLAVGDERGEIIFFHCFEKSKKDQQTSQIASNVVTSKHHWHSYAVSSLSFDAEGAHMYSGGQEVRFSLPPFCAPFFSSFFHQQGPSGSTCFGNSWLFLLEPCQIPPLRFSFPPESFVPSFD